MIVIKTATALVVLILSLFGVVVFCRRRRRRALLTKNVPEQWIEWMTQNVPLYGRLPEELKTRLHGLVQVFLAEKTFEGCGGLKMTDEIKVTIAAQACMLLLNHRGRYFSRLHTILVYPHTYVARAVSSHGGITVEGQSTRLGESWQNGPVVLAWDSVLGGTTLITDGHNVVLHEFAHQLDQEDGAADGAPILEHRCRYTAWAQVLSREYENLRDNRKRFRRSVMDRYGATNPAEFFAVATESFFEKSVQMRKKHPDLYNELRDYYKLDPAEWLTRKKASPQKN